MTAGNDMMDLYQWYGVRPAVPARVGIFLPGIFGYIKENEYENFL